MLLLQNRDPGVRDAAAHALQGSTLADGSAAMQIGMLLENRDPEVRRAAAQALEGTKIPDEQRDRVEGHIAEGIEGVRTVRVTKRLR